MKKFLLKAFLWLQVAADASFAVASGGSKVRAEALRESLQEELDLARRTAATAAAARLRAQEEASRLEQELASSQRDAANPDKAGPSPKLLHACPGSVPCSLDLFLHTLYLCLLAGVLSLVPVQHPAGSVACKRLHSRASSFVNCCMAAMNLKDLSGMQALASEAKELAAKKAALAEMVASYCKGNMPLEEARRLLSQVGQSSWKPISAPLTCSCNAVGEVCLMQCQPAILPE